LYLLYPDDVINNKDERLMKVQRLLNQIKDNGNVTLNEKQKVLNMILFSAEVVARKAAELGDVRFKHHRLI
jgi:hypothetical protein